MMPVKSVSDTAVAMAMARTSVSGPLLQPVGSTTVSHVSGSSPEQYPVESNESQVCPFGSVTCGAAAAGGAAGLDAADEPGDSLWLATGAGPLLPQAASTGSD